MRAAAGQDDVLPGDLGQQDALGHIVAQQIGRGASVPRDEGTRPRCVAVNEDAAQGEAEPGDVADVYVLVLGARFSMTNPCRFQLRTLCDPRRGSVLDCMFLGTCLDCIAYWNDRSDKNNKSNMGMEEILQQEDRNFPSVALSDMVPKFLMGYLFISP